MYGAEYETETNPDSPVRGVSEHDVPCVVCYVLECSAVYMLPAKYTCPNGWTIEYFGYLMTQYYSHPNNFEFTCVDKAFKSVPRQESAAAGLLFHFVEGRCGSLPCPSYDETNELSCAVCTK